MLPTTRQLTSRVWTSAIALPTLTAGQFRPLTACQSRTSYSKRAVALSLLNLSERFRVQVSGVRDRNWTAIAPAGLPSQSTKLVTLSVGGNDVKFKQTLQSCVRGFGKWNTASGCLATAQKFYDEGSWLLRSGGTILVDSTSATWKKCERRCARKGKWLPVSVPSLADVYEQVQDRAPSATIRILLYPHLLPDAPDRNCVVGSFESRSGVTHSYTLGVTEMLKLNSLTDALDDLIIDQAMIAKSRGVNIEVVDPRQVFESHALCDTDRSWINRTSWGAWLFQPNSSSFHPNALGQAGFAGLMGAAPR